MMIGQKVIVTGKLTRYTTYKGPHERWKEWKDKSITETKALFLGWRTISNGRTDWDSDSGYNYCPKEYQKAALVICLDGKTNPFYAPAAEIRLEALKGGAE